jgi:RimJ/RimL family protein N-acetyltransferase
VTLWQIRTVVDDEPGRLSALAGSLADLSVNILSVQVHPVVAGAVDDFVADAPAELTAEELAAAVAAGGGRRATVRPADVHGLADPPTRALQLAARLVRDPECLPLALSDLLGGSTVRWSPGSGPPVSSSGLSSASGSSAGSPGSFADELTETGGLRLRDPRGGHLEISRLDARLTPSETARARALAELASLLESGDADAVRWRRGDDEAGGVRWRRGDDDAGGVRWRRGDDDAGGVRWRRGDDDAGGVRWRRAGRADLDAIIEMHLRCSDETRFRRYNSGLTRLSQRQLSRLVNPRRGVALVGEDSDGRVVALGNLMWCGDDEATPAELGLLVEDAWQGRGLGTAVIRRLLAAALDADCTQVHAVVRPDNQPMLRLLAGLGLPTHRRWEDSMLTVVIELPSEDASLPQALGRPPR